MFSTEWHAFSPTCHCWINTTQRSNHELFIGTGCDHFWARLINLTRVWWIILGLSSSVWDKPLVNIFCLPLNCMTILSRHISIGQTAIIIRSKRVQQQSSERFAYFRFRCIYRAIRKWFWTRKCFVFAFRDDDVSVWISLFLSLPVCAAFFHIFLRLIRETFESITKNPLHVTNHVRLGDVNTRAQIYSRLLWAIMRFFMVELPAVHKIQYIFFTQRSGTVNTLVPLTNLHISCLRIRCYERISGKKDWNSMFYVGHYEITIAIINCAIA